MAAHLARTVGQPELYGRDMPDESLSPRHLRFVTEYLRDGNATQAYIRAGYSARGAQSSASRLLAQPHIDAALSAGRRRLAQALGVTIERVGQEYAKIAFANVGDYLEVEEDGRLRIDLAKASQAQQAGVLDLIITNHGKASQTVKLKLGKLQGLAALTRHLSLFTEQAKPELKPEDRERYEARLAEHERDVQHLLDARRQLARECDEARVALVAAEAKLAAAVHSVPPADEASPEPLQSMATPGRPPVAFSPSPREGGEKVPSVSEADEGLPRATTDIVPIETPRSPSSALRAPSPRLRGEKGDSVSGRSGRDHALTVVRGGAGGREFVRRQPDGPREARREEALALMVGGGIGQLVHAHAARIERQHHRGLALVGVTALAHLDPLIRTAA